MSEIVNLRQFRKRKTREEAQKAAEANRLQFGRTKADRELTEARNALSQRQLDAHRRDAEIKANEKPKS